WTNCERFGKMSNKCLLPVIFRVVLWGLLILNLYIFRFPLPRYGSIPDSFLPSPSLSLSLSGLSASCPRGRGISSLSNGGPVFLLPAARSQIRSDRVPVLSPCSRPVSLLPSCLP